MNQERIAQISEKLSRTQAGFSETDKNVRLEQYEQQVDQMESSFNEFKEQVDKKLNLVRENLIKLNRVIEEVFS